VFPIPVPAQFQIIAHRGASGYAPENTLAAFRLAADMGADHIELDTQLSADGTVVLCHDTTLERYGHGPRPVEAMPAAELLALDMGSFFSPHLYGGEPMLTLERLFENFGDRFTYHVEIKGRAAQLPRQVVDIIQAGGVADRCIVTSFSYEALQATRACSDLPLGWLVQAIDAKTCQQANNLDLLQLCPRADLATPQMTQVAKQTVKQVRAWGAGGTPAEVAAKLRNAVDAGCDGITLNWPDWAANPTTT
jgi:glycerophosphoryl diester phosphodiesterase